MQVCGLEEEFDLSGALPRLLYVKAPAPTATLAWAICWPGSRMTPHTGGLRPSRSGCEPGEQLGALSPGGRRGRRGRAGGQLSRQERNRAFRETIRMRAVNAVRPPRACGEAAVSLTESLDHWVTGPDPGNHSSPSRR